MGSCELGNEPSGSIKVGEILDCFVGCWLLKTLLHVVAYIVKARTDASEFWTVLRIYCHVAS